jgi:hypothetical protein
MNRETSTRNAAWQPTIAATGEKRNYWEHLAIAMRFHRVSDEQWVLAIRPRHHFTTDGTIPLSGEATGKRATSRASHLYNSDVLEEANFWRSYLSIDNEGRQQPRIIWKFGKQSLIIEAGLLDGRITWPGVPDDVKRYVNARPVEDLFTLAEFNRTVEAAVDLDESATEVGVHE